MMPEMNGETLLPQLRAMAPSLKVIGMSGLDQQERLASLTQLGFAEILSKPYEVSTLLRVVDRQLRAG